MLEVHTPLLRPIQQPRLFWDRALTLVTHGSQTHTEVTDCD